MRWWTTRLPLRLWAFAVIPLLASVVLGGMLLLRTLEDEFERRMKKEVQVVARALQLPLTHAVERRRIGSIHKSLESAFKIGGVYGAYLYDEHGELIASLGRTQSPTGRSDVSAALDRGQRSGEYGRVSGREVYSYFVPLSGPGEQIRGLLQVTRRAADIRASMQLLRTRGLWILAFASMLLTFIVLFGYHGAVGRALGRLQGSMARVQAGDSTHRARRSGPREIDALADTLNGMLDSIAAAQTRIRTEQHRRIGLERRLRQSEKLAALGQLAAGVAHELGTPLSVVDGRAQRALRRADLQPAVRDALDNVRGEVRRMALIVRQLLDFGRASAGQRVELRAAAVASAAVAALEDYIRSRAVRVQVDCRETLVVQGDPIRLEQALTNLLKNAVDAANERVEVACSMRDGTVLWTIDDDGPGLAPGTEEHLFEPFFTTKHVGEGTGLGLAITYAVAREHGGLVESAASPLGGARFILQIPHAQRAGSVPPAEPRW